MSAPELLLVGGKCYAGKSTISARFARTAEAGHVEHLSMAGRIRAIAAGRVDSSHRIAGAEAERLKQTGVVPASTSRGILAEFVSESAADLVVVDGLPPYPDRVPALKKMIHGLGTRIVAVAKVEISDQLVHERSRSREPRYDDIVEDANHTEGRLAVYRASGLEVVNTLGAECPYYELDGARPVDDNAAALEVIYLMHSASQDP